jgi:very-short-patch-repair endonuclease
LGKDHFEEFTDIMRGRRIDPVKLERARKMRSRMTPAEELLWEELRAKRLEGFHFRRQQVIEGFIVDFYCHQARLVIEVDGGIHQQTMEYDKERDFLLKTKGLLVLRIENNEIVNNLSDVLERIRFFVSNRSK